MKPGRKPFESKVCPICLVDKPRSEYYKKGENVSHKCKPCTRADNAARAPTYFGKYAAYVNEWKRNKYSTDPLYKEKTLHNKWASYQARADEINRKRRERWANDPYDPARKYNRYHDVRLRTPPWVDLDEVLEIYAACPRGHEVDHIVPLKGLVDGRPVSGLHVPWNLQHLPVRDNRRKKNKVSEETVLSVKR